MEPIYIFGHKNPDTDSVCAAIALSYLKNQLGEKSEPRVLGHLNNETKYVLNYFKVDEPTYLSDVKIQIKDLKYNKKIMIHENASINDAVSIMIDNTITGLPLIDDNKHVTSYVNLKDVSREIARGDISSLNSSYDNIVQTLKGEKFLKYAGDIKGEVIAAAFNSETFMEKVDLKNTDILIVGDRFKILEYAVNSGVKLIIIVGGNKIPKDLLDVAKKKKVNIIYTELSTYETSNMIKLCNYVKDISTNTDPIVVDRLEYLEDFKKRSNKLGHTNYPVINGKEECVGMLTLKDMQNYDKKRVILVDHNQSLQSVEGIEEAEVVEVVDHHNLGTIGTNIPINFRVMPLGSTCTIIYTLFKENSLKMPKEIAGLLLAAIISDTLNLTSPTTTETDIIVVKELSKLCKIDRDKFSYEMFKAGSSLKGRTIDDIVYSDYKEFRKDGQKIFISHVLSMDFDEVKLHLDEYIDLLNEISKREYKMAVIMITDVTKNGSYIVFNDESKDILENIYDIKDLEQGTYIAGLVSRKKQLLPNILEVI